MVPAEKFRAIFDRILLFHTSGLLPFGRPDLGSTDLVVYVFSQEVGTRRLVTFPRSGNLPNGRAAGLKIP